MNPRDTDHEVVTMPKVNRFNIQRQQKDGTRIVIYTTEETIDGLKAVRLWQDCYPPGQQTPNRVSVSLEQHDIRHLARYLDGFMDQVQEEAKAAS